MADNETKAIRIAAKLWPDHNCEIKVKNTRRGYAYTDTRKITIPNWVMLDRRVGYKTYYIAHELAHIHADTHLHNNDFMLSLQALCPKSYLKYERKYKPRAFVAAGLQQ